MIICWLGGIQWDDINFGNLCCMKQCIPQTTIFFFKISDFRKKHLSPFLRIQRWPKQTICTPNGWMNVSTHCATSRWRLPALGGTIGAAGESPICPHFQTSINVGGFHVPWSRLCSHYLRRICDIKCCILQTVLFAWQCTIWNKTSSSLLQCF